MEPEYFVLEEAVRLVREAIFLLHDERYSEEDVTANYWLDKLDDACDTFHSMRSYGYQLEE